MKKTPLSPHVEQKLKILAWLREQFPQAFFKTFREVKPLKLGIFEDIIEFYDRLENVDFSKKALREALNYYSHSKAYLLSQKVGAPRIDLFGNEVDLVTEEQATYAQSRYQNRYVNRQTIK